MLAEGVRLVESESWPIKRTHCGWYPVFEAPRSMRVGLPGRLPPWPIPWTQQVSSFQEPAQDQTDEAKALVEALGYLALAIVQAGAYIANSQMSFKRYLELFKTRRSKLLSERSIQRNEYEFTVYTTWEMSFQRLSQDVRLDMSWAR